MQLRGTQKKWQLKKKFREKNFNYRYSGINAMAAEFNPEEAKALQNSLNAEAPFKDWNRERL
jgi:hypothetical protein